MVAILFIGGIVALVWSVLALRHGGMLTGCLAVIFVGSCFGHAFFHVSVGPLPITFDRLMLAGLLVVFAVSYRTSLVDAKPLALADWALGSLLLVLTISTLTHDWQIDGSQPAATLLFFYGLPMAIYWLARQAQLDRHHLHLLLGFFAVFGLYLACTAIAEKQQIWSLVFPRYIASLDHEEFFGRGRGPFLNPIGCGLYMTCGLVSWLFAWPHLQRFGRAAILASAAVIVVGIYCTLTRSVWLGMGLGIVLVTGLSVPKSWRVPLFVSLAIAGTSLLAIMGSSLSSFKRDKHVSVHEMRESTKLRPILATVAWRMFQDRPFLGHGFGQYKQIDMDYLRDPTSNLPLEKARPYVQHNVFLALLTETGLVGLTLYLTMMGLWTRSAWQVWSCSRRSLAERQMGLLMLVILASHVSNGMFHDVSIIAMSNMLLFLIAGVCQGVAGRPVTSTCERFTPSSDARAAQPALSQ
ncbi:MAG: O-antigen ligase family protein [Pirellulaceae bacterium]|jgi:O-antigen ligase|nr:O-antigen ligase family protein [Pirellulaceae bacterium]